MVVVALLLGEAIAPRQWLTYVPIWSAVGVLVAEGASRYVGLRGAKVPSVAVGEGVAGQ
jgi:chloramphenicol-sensitive protein RarD